MGKVRVHDDNYYVVQAWMITKLKLKGLEKDLFAIIYGFSQDGEHDFHGSLEYLSQLTGYTRNRICDTLQHLIELNYIQKTVNRKDELKPSSYVVNPIIIDTHDCPKDLDSCPKDLDSDSSKMSDNCPKNLDKYISTIKNNKNKKDKKDIRQKTPLFESTSSNNTVQEFVNMYKDICKDNPQLSNPRVVTDKRKKMVITILKKYGKDTIVEVLGKVSKSDFLLGKTGGTWCVDFNWIFKEDNFVKILEGNYDTSHKKKSKISELPCNKGVKSRKFTKEEQRKKEQMLREMRERGEQIEY